MLKWQVERAWDFGGRTLNEHWRPDTVINNLEIMVPQFRKGLVGDQRDSTTGRALGLHVADLDFIFGTPYGTPGLSWSDP